MVVDYNLQFIEKKLSEVKTAVMYTDGNNVIKLPNDVVTFLKVDDTGKVWFTAHKPRCGLTEYDQLFPLRLCFYRKGVGFCIETSGVASIANNEDADQFRDELNENVFLLKMTPHLVEYTEFGKKYAFPGIKQWWSTLTKWFTDNFSFINTKQIPLTGIEKTKNYG